MLDAYVVKNMSSKFHGMKKFVKSECFTFFKMQSLGNMFPEYLGSQNTIRIRVGKIIGVDYCEDCQVIQYVD